MTFTAVDTLSQVGTHSGDKRSWQRESCGSGEHSENGKDKDCGNGWSIQDWITRLRL